VTEQIPSATKAQVKDYLMRHKRYDNIDGTTEMGFGLLIYLGFPIGGYVSSILEKNCRFAVFTLMFGLVFWGTKAIKKHITWPRTGYMEPLKARRSVGPLTLTMLAGAVVAAGLFFVVRYGRLNDAIMLPRILGLAAFAAAYAFFAFRWSQEHPWKRFVALFFAASLLVYAIARPGVSNAEFFQPVMIFTGIVWLASGGITLYLYIRRTQPPAAESE
jgi:hypothetical protein